jgi:hypothetical protein
MRRTFLVLMIGLVSLTAVGCQVLLASIKSPIDSSVGTVRIVGGSLQGTLRSSGIGGRGAGLQEYKRDLRQYAALYVQQGGDGAPQDFQRGITRIAESHGIAHWEGEPATPYAIGQGFRDAQVSEAAMREFCAALGADTLAAKYALEGWHAGGS